MCHARDRYNRWVDTGVEHKEWADRSNCSGLDLRNIGNAEEAINIIYFLSSFPFRMMKNQNGGVPGAGTVGPDEFSDDESSPLTGQEYGGR